MSSPHDRPAHGNPGGCYCELCGVVFIGAPHHILCAVCKASECLRDAAPDLLAALIALHDWIDEYAEINHLGGFDNHEMRQARAAIIKAEGRP